VNTQRVIVLLLVALSGVLAVVFWSLAQIRAQRRSESELVLRLADDDAFMSVLLDYFEAADRDGEKAAAAELRAVIDAITDRLDLGNRGDSVIYAALNQPSQIGRMRYLEKLTVELADNMQHGPGSLAEVG
jgi:hypothetical protein